MQVIFSNVNYRNVIVPLHAEGVATRWSWRRIEGEYLTLPNGEKSAFPQISFGDYTEETFKVMLKRNIALGGYEITVNGKSVDCNLLSDVKVTRWCVMKVEVGSTDSMIDAVVANAATKEELEALFPEARVLDKVTWSCSLLAPGHKKAIEEARSKGTLIIKAR